MGRFEKVIVSDKGVDKRESGYYSTPSFVADYLSEQLMEVNPHGKKVLDPAVGEEELTKPFFLKGIQADSFDIIEHCEIRYSNFEKRDFIEFYQEKKKSLFFANSINLEYDFYVANPPYNCHEIEYIRDRKGSLRSLFGAIGTHNMYAMFLSAIIDCAKVGAAIGVIISDSFLTATVHGVLRQQILDECAIHQLILCPNDLFLEQKADVRTCILILQKGRHFQRGVKISNRPRNAQALRGILERKDFDVVNIENLILGRKRTANQFIVGVEQAIVDLFSKPRLGGKFDCITGISTGNDKRYLSKNRKEGFEIPFYKNPGSRKFLTEPDAYLVNNFMEESSRVEDFMIRNKSFLFNEGITCSSMGLPFGACYLPAGSTFGVNANIFPPKQDIYWLISYLNSHLVTYLVRGVINRSNMVTSGYISQIPLLDFTEHEKQRLGAISKSILDQKMDVFSGIEEINAIVYDNIGFSQCQIKGITDFVSNLSSRV